MPDLREPLRRTAVAALVVGSVVAAAWIGGLQGRDADLVDDQVSTSPGTVLATGPVPQPTVERPGTRPTEERGRPGRAAQTPLLWPHDDDRPRWRQGRPEQAALAFGREVLGWKDATFEGGEPAHDGTGGVWSFLHEGSGPLVAVLIVPKGGEPHEASAWAIARVSLTDAGETPFSVTVRGRDVAAGFDWWNDTNEAELIVTYGEREFAATVTSPPASFEVTLPFEPEGPGSVLIKFRNAGNSVVGAQGMGVAAGDVTSD